jgi:hypothetical protein
MRFCAVHHASSKLAAAGLVLFALHLMAGCGPQKPALLETPAVPGASLPRLSIDPAGVPWLSWVEPTERGHALRYASFEAGAWGDARTAAEGDDWFINWADFPSVRHLGDGRLAAHWLRKVEGGPYAYHLYMAVSRDGGERWSDPITPHEEATPTEHGFASLFALADGAGAVWLDGRHTGGGHDSHDEHGHGAMALRAGGLDWTGNRLPETELDPMTCDCCPTAVAALPDGVVVVYRDRSPAEIRDIRAATLGPDGWSEPVLVADDGWEMPACPVNGPAVAAIGTRVAAAWFTAAGGVPVIRASFSADGGRNWDTAVSIAEGSVLGRVAIVMPNENSAVVSWLEQSRGRADIRFRRIDRDGDTGPAYKLATTVAARSSGFPQMALLGDRLLFAWTEVGDPSVVRTATAPLP